MMLRTFRAAIFGLRAFGGKATRTLKIAPGFSPGALERRPLTSCIWYGLARRVPRLKPGDWSFYIRATWPGGQVGRPGGLLHVALQAVRATPWSEPPGLQRRPPGRRCPRLKPGAIQLEAVFTRTLKGAARTGAAMAVLALPLSAQMGSPGGGHVQGIALDPSNPMILYAGAAKGLCKTTKGGLDNWPSVGLEPLGPNAIVVDPEEPQIVYAGTYSSGVWRSPDAGGAWEPVNDGITYPDIRAMAIDPENPETVYAATDGGGVFKTVNGGESWDESNVGLIDKTIRALVIDPKNPETLYAGTWHGVYKTTDGAATWSADPQGPLYDVDVRALALDPTNPQVVYAGTDPRGVFRSDDGGKTWTKSAAPLTERILSLAVDPKTPSDVYAGTTSGVFRSRDRGMSWEPAGLHWSARAWTLVFDDRTTPPTLYYGGEGGVLKTQDGGLHWEVTGPKRN